MSLGLGFEVLTCGEFVYMDKETLATAVCFSELGNARLSGARN